VGSATINLRFPGQYFDQETGLHYNYFRDYDPQTGRYVESDPIGLDGGLNTYGYVEGNPLSYFDAYGLTAEGNHKLDPAQVERIKEQLKDPNLDKKTRNALQKKLNTHEKAMGKRGSRKTKGGKIRSISGPLIHIELACIAGAAPCELCESLDFPNPNCPVGLRCEEDNNTPASPAPVPPSFPGWSSPPRPDIIDLGQQ